MFLADGLRDTGPIQKKQQQQKIQIMFQPKAQGPSTAWLNAYVLVPSTELSGSGKTRKIINTVEVTGTGNNVDVHLESEKLQSTEKLLLPEMRRTRSSRLYLHVKDIVTVEFMISLMSQSAIVTNLPGFRRSRRASVSIHCRWLLLLQLRSRSELELDRPRDRRQGD